MPECNFSAIFLRRQTLLPQDFIFAGNAAQRPVEPAGHAGKIRLAALAFHGTGLHPNTFRRIMEGASLLTGCDHPMNSF
jgi:hypothetical protein